MKRWVFLAGFLLFLLYWRWLVGLNRFFDVDEFSYLHWASNVAQGQRPYTDFFMFFTPGFLWLFAPLVKLFWMSVDLFIAARMVSFFIFVAILGTLGVLFGKTRGWKWSLLPVILLAFLPMPYDKFLEVRPDNLATLLAMGGLVAQVIAMAKEKTASRLWFTSGFLYMASLVVFVKTLPFVFVGMVVWWLAKGSKKAFIMGAVIPFFLFVLWLVTLGDMGAAWYSLTKLPFEANSIGAVDIMEPHLFFFPNGSFYGGSSGITLGLILNHAVWLVGIFMGVIRFFTPFVTTGGDRKKVLIELLIGGTFLLSVLGYVQFFPLKHSQYLIPIAMFIVYYCADALVLGLERMRRPLQWAFLVIFVYLFATATIQVNRVKLSWNNATQLSDVQRLISMVPANAHVVDLEGKMLFWPDGYYICCVPFGSFEQFLSRRPTPLRQILETEKTPYIFQGDTARLSLLSVEDREYIREHYAPVSEWGEALWQRK